MILISAYLDSCDSRIFAGEEIRLAAEDRTQPESQLTISFLPDSMKSLALSKSGFIINSSSAWFAKSAETALFWSPLASQPSAGGGSESTPTLPVLEAGIFQISHA